ncbi:MAG: AAA family ATPase, partial [Phycisphaerales bacterium]
MPKPRQIFACRTCGAVQTKWMGKCPDCGTWDALEAQRVEVKAKTDPRAMAVQSWSRGAATALERAEAQEGPDEPGARGVLDAVPLLPSSRALPISAVDAGGSVRRVASGVGELDRVLGGGFVPGSAIMLGGDPGIGKSTLLLQVAGALARQGTRVLYVSSEESAEQVKLRAGRLCIPGAGDDAPVPVLSEHELFLLAETSLARIQEQAAQTLSEGAADRPKILIIDSIQMIYKADLDAFP